MKFSCGRTQPAQNAIVMPEPRLVRAVGAAAVVRRAEEEAHAALRHHRRDRGPTVVDGTVAHDPDLGVVRPPVAAGHEAGGAVLLGEVADSAIITLQNTVRCGRGKRYRTSSAWIAWAGSPGPMATVPYVLRRQSSPSTARATGRIPDVHGQRAEHRVGVQQIEVADRAMAVERLDQ